MTEESAREAVQIGVDLRPIPIPVGDDVWLFTPDPDKQFFKKTTQASKMMQADDDTRWDAVDVMREALVEALVDETQQDAFAKKNYGLTVLSAIAGKYSEVVVGVPTKSASASGPGQKRAGATK